MNHSVFTIALAMCTIAANGANATSDFPTQADGGKSKSERRDDMIRRLEKLKRLKQLIIEADAEQIKLNAAKDGLKNAAQELMVIESDLEYKKGPTYDLPRKEERVKAAQEALDSVIFFDSKEKRELEAAEKELKKCQDEIEANREDVHRLENQKKEKQDELERCHKIEDNTKLKCKSLDGKIQKLKSELDYERLSEHRRSNTDT